MQKIDKEFLDTLTDEDIIVIQNYITERKRQQAIKELNKIKDINRKLCELGYDLTIAIDCPECDHSFEYAIFNDRLILNKIK